jgi:hypothetical protein
VTQSLVDFLTCVFGVRCFFRCDQGNGE